MDTITRKVDEQSKIALPASMNVLTGDKFQISEVGGNILLTRYAVACFTCGESDDVKELGRAYLCGVCREAVEKSLKEVS